MDESPPMGKVSRVIIDREALTLEARRKFENTDVQKRDNWQSRIRSSVSCSTDNLRNNVKKRIPILDWATRYEKSWLLGDLISGITIAIVHVPMGLGFAMLANVPPIAGIYMAVIHGLVYPMFASSQYCSMGSFAVITLMTGKVVREFATFPDERVGGAMNGENSTLEDTINILTSDGVDTYTPFQIATVLALTVGLWHILFGMLQLGRLCVFIADVLIAGFTTAAAVHVITSQLKHIIGVSIPAHSGPFKVIYTYIEIFKAFPTINYATVIIAAITMPILAINNEFLKPKVAKKTRVPVPIELIVVIMGIAVCYVARLNMKYGVIIIGEIPGGLPPPSVPPLEMISKVAVDSFAIAVVSYVLDYSVGKIFAIKNGHVIDATQELYAHGLTNIFGSFFLCPPMANALIRSVIIDSIGGQTQLVSLISAFILIPILLWIGPLFEYLPNAVFASIIIVTLKSMIMQITLVPSIWKVARIDATIWMVTFLSTVIIDIDYGLLIGIIFSLFVLLCKSQNPTGYKMGRLETIGNELVNVKKFPEAKEAHDIVVYQICGGLHFANREALKADIIAGTGWDPKIMQKQSKLAADDQQTITDMETGQVNPGFESEGGDEVKHQNGDAKVGEVDQENRYLILDLSMVAYIDYTAGKLLVKLRGDYEKSGVSLCLAGIPDAVHGSLERTNVLSSFHTDHLFHSSTDGVAILKSKSFSTQNTNM